MAFPLKIKRFGKLYTGTIDLEKGYTLHIDGANITFQSMKAVDAWLTINVCQDECQLSVKGRRRLQQEVQHAKA